MENLINDDVDLGSSDNESDNESESEPDQGVSQFGPLDTNWEFLSFGAGRFGDLL